MNFGKGNHADYTVGQAVITENTAQVPVTMKDKGKNVQIKLTMRREANQWKIYAVTFPLYPGEVEITLDLEHL